MLLRNFYNALALMFTGSEFNGSTYGDGTLAIKNMSGNVVTNTNSLYLSYSNYLSCLFPMMTYSSIGSRVLFGTNNTEVSFDDYTLENYKSITCKQYMYEGIKYDPDTKTYSNTIRLTLKNETGSDVVVKEVGICGEYKSWLMYREVMDAPITIPAGATVTYRHEFKFVYPTF